MTESSIRTVMTCERSSDCCRETEKLQTQLSAPQSFAVVSLSARLRSRLTPAICRSALTSADPCVYLYMAVYPSVQVFVLFRAWSEIAAGLPPIWTIRYNGRVLFLQAGFYPRTRLNLDGVYERSKAGAVLSIAGWCLKRGCKKQ